MPQAVQLAGRNTGPASPLGQLALGHDIVEDVLQCLCLSRSHSRTIGHLTEKN